jgi:DNA-binding NtrC family response regulator
MVIDTPGERIDVLVIDDEPVVRFTMVEVLRASGLKVAHAADALMALTKLSMSSVGAIVLDIKLPGLDGFGFLDAVPEPPPVVVVSGGVWDDEVAARRGKVFACVRKPIDASSLIALVGDALGAPQGDPAVA